MNETDPLYSSIIVNCVFNAFSACTAIMLNILTIHAMRKTSSLPKPLKTLLLSLVVSDLGVGLLAQPLFIAVLANDTVFTHIAFNVVQIVFTVASFSSVVAISVDRFLAVHLHLRYQELVTHKRVSLVVFSFWALSVLHGALRFSFSFSSAEELVYEVIVVIILGVCFIIAGIANCRIYFSVRRHKNQMQVQQIQIAWNSQMESATRQRKSAVSTFYVFLVFLICCLPTYCAKVALSIFRQSSSFLNGLLLYTGTLTFLNSSLNPVIYCWKMRHIRRAMMDTLRNMFLSQS